MKIRFCFYSKKRKKKNISIFFFNIFELLN